MGAAVSSCLPRTEAEERGGGGLKLLHARLSGSSGKRSMELRGRRRANEIDADDNCSEMVSERKAASVPSISTLAEVVDTRNLDRIFDSMQSEERHLYALGEMRRSDSFNEWLY